MKKQYRKNDVIIDVPAVAELQELTANCKQHYSVNALNLTTLSGKLLYTIGPEDFDDFKADLKVLKKKYHVR